jgi:tripartite-type tricarboxylate transporter receptor subunit TctC
VPTMAEAYPGLEMPSWIGVWVAAGTPPAIVQRLHAEFAKATHTAEVTRRLLDNGLEPAITTPEETAALIQREAEAMGRIIKAKNIKLE